MKLMSKKTCYALLISLILFLQTANATLAPMLPESSYEDGRWQGLRFFNEEADNGGYLTGRVDFAVYDTENLQFQDEADWVSSLDLNQEKQFLYVYQIFNDYQQSDREVAYFEVFAESGAQLGVDSQDIDAKEDENTGVQPADGYLDSSGEKVVWTWDDPPLGNGLLYKDDHSWYLIILSDSAPVIGDFNVRALEDSGEFPAAGVPEPATIALFGIAQVLVIATRRRKHRVKKC